MLEMMFTRKVLGLHSVGLLDMELVIRRLVFKIGSSGAQGLRSGFLAVTVEMTSWFIEKIGGWDGLASMIQDETLQKRIPVADDGGMSNVSKTNRTIKLNFASDTKPPARKLGKSL